MLTLTPFEMYICSILSIVVVSLVIVNILTNQSSKSVLKNVSIRKTEEARFEQRDENIKAYSFIICIILVVLMSVNYNKENQYDKEVYNNDKYEMTLIDDKINIKNKLSKEVKVIDEYDDLVVLDDYRLDFNSNDKLVESEIQSIVITTEYEYSAFFNHEQKLKKSVNVEVVDSNSLNGKAGLSLIKSKAKSAGKSIKEFIEDILED